MSDKYTQRIVSIAVLPEGEPIFSERATIIRIVDKAAGEYIEIEQQIGHVETKEQTVALNPGPEWEAIKKAVDDLSAEIAKNEKG